MSKQHDLDKLWRELIVKGQEIAQEVNECKKRRGTTPRYLSLVKDEQKLKAEYERRKGLGEMDPLSIKHGEKMMDEKITGDLMGRNGPDTHHGVGGDKNRKAGA